MKPREENLGDVQPQRVDDEMQNAETSAPGVVMDTNPPQDADLSETVGTTATTSDECILLTILVLVSTESMHAAVGGLLLSEGNT